MQRPDKDNRMREWPSESLWVLIRSPKEGMPESVGINESIERTVYRLKGYSGQYVRYQNFYHPIHPEKEFQEYLEKAISGEIEFFSNEAGMSGDNPNEIRQIGLARFIFDDEAIASAP